MKTAGNERGLRETGTGGLRFWSRLRIGASAALICAFAGAHGTAAPEERALKLYNIHTKESATIVFKRNGVYDRAGLDRLNKFLRDWRRDKPTNMDPHLFDLVWQAYKLSGSSDYIHVICGFRSPETNGALRRRSKGVAKNSLHMQGKAMDFFIAGVPLAKLREVGLKLGNGGVGFYPRSGAPFVHMDTGSVRHWPRMTREQLVKVFPNGKTMHVPSDGKPLPGYAVALAAYKARKGGETQIASFNAPSSRTPEVAEEPMVVAAAVSVDEEFEDEPMAVTPALKTKDVGVAVGTYATEPMPLPRLAPKREQAVAAVEAVEAIDEFDPPQVLATPADVAAEVAAYAPAEKNLAPDFDFDADGVWSAPAVPSALAQAMADRDQLRRDASLPIAPTAVVATIEVTRPLRAEAITTAVLRKNGDVPEVPQVLAFAPSMPEGEAEARQARSSALGVPIPQTNPLRSAAMFKAARTHAVPPRVRHRLPPAELMLTALDTQGLRMWIGTASTRQKVYALLTMPDFASEPSLLEKPEVSFAAGFGRTAYNNLRTDRFSGPLVQQPVMFDLAPTELAQK